VTGDITEYVTCLLLGALVAATELMGRYRDSPRLISQMPAFWLYVSINAGFSALALALARANNWTFGLASVTTANVARIVVSGAAGLAVLRSGIALIRIGDREVPAGPGALVTGLLVVIERVIDRRQARDRSAAVAACMKGVRFDRAFKVLPKHCLLLLRNATPEETHALAAAVAEMVEDVSSSDQAKAYNLGIALINFTGPEVLNRAVETLRDEIAPTSPLLDLSEDSDLYSPDD
jgi:hypothetical protein